MQGRQEDIETSILRMLYEESERSARRLKPRQLAEKFVPSVGEVRVAAGLQHLQKQRLVSGSFDNFNASGFLITREGLLFVENRFEKVDKGSDTRWTERKQKQGENCKAAGVPLTITAEKKIDEEPSPPNPLPAITINNNFSPANSIGPSPSPPDNYGKSSAMAGWVNVWVALIVGLSVIAITLWLSGKF